MSDVSTITIRRATQADLPRLLALEQQTAMAPHWSPAIWTRVLNGGLDTLTLLAEAGAECTGFLVLRLAADVVEMESIVVAQLYQRQGLARALCREGVRWAVEQGATELQLEVRASNAVARSFYEKFGFMQQGVRPQYYRQPAEDAILLVLSLPPTQP